MNTRSSSYTGRAARSLEEAFGPYTSQHFVELNPPHTDWSGRVIAFSVVLSVVVVIVAHFIR